MPALDDMAQKRLEALEKDALRRAPTITAPLDGKYVMRRGNKLLSFSSNDYFGLAHHPDVIKAAQDAAAQYGAGAGASRLVTGENPLYRELESEISHIKGTQAACIFSSGYLATLGTITALAGKDDLIIADKLAHACMIDAAQLSGAKLLRFAHNDMAHLQQLLEAHRGSYQHCLILTETVFSMDGDIAPMAEIIALARQHNAWTLSDDAHGLGLVKLPATDIQLGTLSKAAGSLGGYVCASHAVINLLKSTARSLIYTTALPPAILAASLAALRIIGSQSERAQTIHGNAQLLTQELGLPAVQGAIVPLIIGEAEKAIEASGRLEDAGYLVSAIRPPTVPKGTARLRFTLSALHTEAEIRALAQEIRKYEWC